MSTTCWGCRAFTKSCNSYHTLLKYSGGQDRKGAGVWREYNSSLGWIPKAALHSLKHAKLSPGYGSSVLPTDWQPQCRCSTLPEWRTRLRRGELRGKRSRGGRTQDVGGGARWGQESEVKSWFIRAGQSQSTHVTLMHKDGTDVAVSAEWQLVMHPSFSSPPASQGESPLHK